MLKEVPKILCVTRSMLIEKFKVGGSIARALIKDLSKQNLIIPWGKQHHSFDLYKGSLAKTAQEKAAADAQAEIDALNKKKGVKAEKVDKVDKAEKAEKVAKA